MNITPITFCTTNVKSKNILKDMRQCTNEDRLNVLSYDTVSFGSASSEVNKLSKQVYENVKKGNYSYARGLLRHVCETGFNPNFFTKNADGQNISLMGLIIEKFANIKQYSAKTTDALLLFATVLFHENFDIYNKDAEKDLFLKAIENHLPVPMLTMFYNSFAFTKIPINEKYKTYAEILHENGYENIATDMLQTYQQYDSMVNQKTKNYSKYYDEDGNQRVDLDSYRVDLLPTDPLNLDEVGGLFEAKDDIREYIIRPWDEKYRQKIEDNGIKRPSGILLSGPPGCGKTYIAKAIAGETGYDLYCIDLSNVGSSYAYETSQNIAGVFDALEEKYKITGQPSIAFLDEMESIASSRQGSNQDWKRDDVNELLKAINNSAQRGIIVIGATNYYEAIDKAATRSGRLDTVIKIDYPDEVGREDIIEKILKDKEVAKDIIQYKKEFAQVTDGMSPADISTVLNNMMLKAIYDNRDFADKNDFYAALEVVRRKNDMSGIKPIGFKRSDEKAVVEPVYKVKHSGPK